MNQQHTNSTLYQSLHSIHLSYLPQPHNVMVHPKSQYIEGDGPFMDYDPTIQKTQVQSIAKEPESMSNTSHRTQLETTDHNVPPPNDTSSDTDSSDRTDHEDDGSIEGRISYLAQSIYTHFHPHSTNPSTHHILPITKSSSTRPITPTTTPTLWLPRDITDLVDDSNSESEQSSNEVNTDTHHSTRHEPHTRVYPSPPIQRLIQGELTDDDASTDVENNSQRKPHPKTLSTNPIDVWMVSMMSIGNNDYEDQCWAVDKHEDKTQLIMEVKTLRQTMSARRKRQQLMKRYVDKTASTELQQILLPNGKTPNWSDREKRQIVKQHHAKVEEEEVRVNAQHIQDVRYYNWQLSRASAIRAFIWLYHNTYDPTELLKLCDFPYLTIDKRLLSTAERTHMKSVFIEWDRQATTMVKFYLESTRQCPSDTNFTEIINT